MGGHTQIGEFDTLEAAVKCWQKTVKKAVEGYKLHFSYGNISYDGETGKYCLGMRFTK